MSFVLRALDLLPNKSDNIYMANKQICDTNTRRATHEDQLFLGTPLRCVWPRDPVRRKQRKVENTHRSSGAMCGTTPPWEMTTSPRSLFNSSSLRMASCKWRGTILIRRCINGPYAKKGRPTNSRTVASCYRARRCPPARESQRRGIQGPRRGRRVHQHRHAARSSRA